MKRLLTCVLACFVLTLGAAHAIPARLPYEPPPTAIDLRGTTWSGYNDAVKANWTVLFEPDGTFNYSYGGASYHIGTWRAEGNSLYYETNKKYAEFQGVIQGNTIQGQGWNVAGLRWQILLNRVPSPR
ncbi:MAG: hypothetical protein EXR98_02520 [Gemmataceae bacterium]|nr:hypothetical protein [Gemmataceae bacterium]